MTLGCTGVGSVRLGFGIVFMLKQTHVCHLPSLGNACFAAAGAAIVLDL